MAESGQVRGKADTPSFPSSSNKQTNNKVRLTSYSSSRALIDGLAFFRLPDWLGSVSLSPSLALCLSAWLGAAWLHGWARSLLAACMHAGGRLAGDTLCGMIGDFRGCGRQAELRCLFGGGLWDM